MRGVLGAESIPDTIFLSYEYMKAVASSFHEHEYNRVT